MHEKGIWFLAEGNQIIDALRRGSSFKGLAKEKALDKKFRRTRRSIRLDASSQVKSADQ
jgi:hypothetical protein